MTWVGLESVSELLKDVSKGPKCTSEFRQVDFVVAVPKKKKGSNLHRKINQAVLLIVWMANG